MKSGLSWGGGLTQDYQRFEKDGIAYMDAPGLADETILEQAAQAITKALKQSGNYKLFFLVRLQNGRVVSEDLVTLKRVLDSIDAGDLNYKFTIVLNALSRRQYETLVARGDEFKTIKTLVNRKYQTESFCFIPRIEALEDKSDTIAELPLHVLNFMDSEAPVITVQARQVKPIAVTGFARQSEEIRVELERLRTDQAALLKTMREHEQRHGEAMKRMRASHAVELRHLSDAAALSPRANDSYIALPLTPPIVPPNASEASWVRRRRKLIVALIIVVIVIIAIVVGVGVATKRKQAKTALSTPSPTPVTSTPIPTPTATDTSKGETDVDVSAAKAPQFLGCLTDEAMLSSDKVYSGNDIASSANYTAALHQAEVNDKTYFAIARLGVNGHAFAFNKLLVSATAFDGNDAGCKRACPGYLNYFCGCADTGCEDAGVKPGKGQKLNRRWAVYKRDAV